LSWYTDHQLEQDAPLAVAAWIFGYMGERDRALRFAEAAKNGSWQGPMPDGAASLESAVSTLSAVLAIGGITGMAADAQRTVDLEPTDSPWRIGALTLLGQAQSHQRRLRPRHRHARRGRKDQPLATTPAAQPHSPTSPSSTFEPGKSSAPPNEPT
jgi:hypothetical protein